jgi:hypothetical protein
MAGIRVDMPQASRHCIVLCEGETSLPSRNNGHQLIHNEYERGLKRRNLQTTWTPHASLNSLHDTVNVQQETRKWLLIELCDTLTGVTFVLMALQLHRYICTSNKWQLTPSMYKKQHRTQFVSYFKQSRRLLLLLLLLLLLFTFIQGI